MLNSIVRTALRLRVVVIVLSGLLLAWGFHTAENARLDVFPDFAPPQVVIQTEAPGLTAEQVERLVTLPVETRVNGAGGLATLRSESIQGLSIVTAVFEDDVDPRLARQTLSERITELAGELPRGVGPPKLTPLTSATMDLLKVGLLSDRCSPMELRTFARLVLQPRLLAVQGVATVTLFGGEVEELQIRAHPEAMAALGIALDDLLAAARNASGVRGAGFVEARNQRVVLESHASFSRPEDLADAVLATPDGRVIRIGDVATVVSGAQAKYGDALVQGRPGVLLTMLSQYGANTMEVTRGVEAALEELAPVIQAKGITLFPRLHRPATFIEHSIRNLQSSLSLGALLVAVVLFLFLYNIRTALVSLLAIPLSLGAAVVVLHAAGVTLNTITLGGLAVALGEVVDDAIIDVENIFRRLRENDARGRPRSPFSVVLDASIEVRRAVVFATLTVGLVFVPVLTLSGLQGRMFAPLAVAYLLAVGASLLVALLVTPAVCLVLLPSITARAKEPRFLVFARTTYRSVLRVLVARPWITLGAALLMFSVSLGLVPRMGFEFLPRFREGHFVVHVTLAPGTSLDEMKRVGSRLSDQLLAISSVDTVEQQIGRAELGEDPWPPNRSELHIELEASDPEEESRAEAEIRDILASTPGIRSDVLTFLGDRIGETISGETAAVVVSVFGEDLDVLDATGRTIAEHMASVPGAVDIQTSSVPGSPMYDVDLSPRRLLRHGLQPVPVLDSIQAAFQGETVGQVSEGTQVRDVVVIFDEEHRRFPEQVADVRVRGIDGSLVPISAVADLHETAGRGLILHEGGRRRAAVTCNVEGRDVAGFSRELEAKVRRDVVLPPGTYLSFGGEAATERAARSELLLHASIAFLGVFLLLWIAFRRVRTLLLVLLNLPFALVGGIVAISIAGDIVSLGTLVGFVTLFGITTRNSIMMLSHFEHLVTVEGAAWNVETALRGASERFGPIVMTSLVTGLGLLPLALASGAAGREIEGPMAAVILGGLLTSTTLNLLLLPGLALLFGRFGALGSEDESSGSVRGAVPSLVGHRGPVPE